MSENRMWISWIIVLHIQSYAKNTIIVAFLRMYKTRCISQTRFVRATIDRERVWIGLFMQQSSKRPIKSYNSQSARRELSSPRLGIDRAALVRNIRVGGLVQVSPLDNLWSVWCLLAETLYETLRKFTSSQLMSIEISCIRGSLLICLYVIFN